MAVWLFIFKVADILIPIQKRKNYSFTKEIVMCEQQQLKLVKHFIQHFMSLSS